MDSAPNYAPESGFFEITPSSWEIAKRLAKLLTPFVFRGHTNKSWRLTTSLERLSNRLDSSLEYLPKRENRILKRFMARAHQYLQSPPKDSELIEWLSIIQDYGGPTRLLDFTKSFYIASFFALEGATDDSCVWAVSNVHLVISGTMTQFAGLEQGRSFNRSFDTLDPEPVLRFAESVILDSSKSTDKVLRVTPPRLNERLALQKGLFLFPCNLTKSFEANLCKSIGLHFDTLDSPHVIPLKFKDLQTKLAKHDLSVGIVRINLPTRLHKDAIRDLSSMNIDASTLFPGLEGFARSLNMDNEIGWENMDYSINLTPKWDTPVSPNPADDPPQDD